MLTWEDYNQDETVTSAPEPAVVAAAAAAQRVVDEPAEPVAETAAAEPDDRRLYWRRLLGLYTLHKLGADEAALLAFEQHSRGLPLNFAEDADLNVLVSGFDPFHLDADYTCMPFKR